MAQKTLKITEQDLHRIIKESVNKVLNEISDDTVGATYDKLAAKRREMYNDPKYTDAERRHIADRVEKMGKEYHKRRNGTVDKPASLAHQAKFDQRHRERQSGQRTFDDHYGTGKRQWRTMPKKDE